jgi:hypothetical protein
MKIQNLGESEMVRMGVTLAGLAVVGIVSLASGGCRIGNYSSTSGSTQPDGVTGYYDANPQSLTFCAATSAATTCKDAVTSKIPTEISGEITNPLALILEDASTGEAAMTAATGSGQAALPIYVDTTDDTTLSFSYAYSPQTLWSSAGCTTRQYLDEQGSIVRGQGHLVAGTKSGMTVGSLTLDVQVIRSFDSTDGSCAADQQVMSDCYQNVSQCGGADASDNQARQDYVRELFETYIQAGAMTATDIATVTQVAYGVHYQ